MTSNTDTMSSSPSTSTATDEILRDLDARMKAIKLEVADLQRSQQHILSILLRIWNEMSDAKRAAREGHNTWL